MKATGKFIFNIILRLIQVIIAIIWLLIMVAYFVSLIVIMPFSWIIAGNKGADYAKNQVCRSHDAYFSLMDWFNMKTS